ncbi:hypothetical protein Tco_1105870 [Tanacetum coccineum]
MAQLKYCDKHNQVGFLRKPDESAGFAEIVDFLRGSNLRYALTSNPTIYDSLVKQFWQTATANTKADGSLEINATIDTIGYTITEASIRDSLHLEDATGITMLPNDELFEGMGQMGYPTDGTLLLKKFFTPQEIFSQRNMSCAPSQPSSSTPPVPSTSSPPVLSTPTPIPATIPSPTPIPETEPEPFEHTFEEPSPVHQPFSPPQEQAQGQMAMDDLLQLVKKVKKLEGLLKKRHVVLSDSEEEEPEAQGRKSQDDPLDSSVQGLVTPSTTKVNASGEEQVEDISPNTLEAAKTLSKFSSLDFQEEVDAGAAQVNTAEGVNTGSIKLSTVSEQLSTGTEQKMRLNNTLVFTLSSRIAKKKYLNEQQKKRKAQNQGTWKLSQLKNLSFEEVKEEFDKLVKQVESFAPINFEATKASLKRFDLDKDDSEDSDEVGEQEESVTGTKTPINHVPVAMKIPSIATYKIIKQGEKGVYQIVREDGTDIVYINFGAMLKDISRDDLTELYRIVMNRYGMDGLEDELEKVFWKYLKNMFEEPLSTNPIWSELGQQRIISWRYYDSCRVHCLNLESKRIYIYMLIERTYPLSAEMCKAMLDKKLQGGKPDENCYKMLKMMEKQAGIRK